MSIASQQRIILDCQGVFKSFQDKRVLHDVNLQIAKGQIVALVGPSGCGKSTLLKSVLGILSTTEGTVMISRNRVFRAIEGVSSDIGIVFQSYGLMPFLTIEENVALGLDFMQMNLFDRMHGFINPWSKWRRMRSINIERARELLKRMGLERSMKLYPEDLSGGMRQRVSIAQALITKPRIVLMDEPFGALDEAMRESLQDMMLEFYSENERAVKNNEEPPYTIMIVTHELNEAIYVSDRIIGLSQYWDWKTAGFAESPGATIIYDKSAPIFRPGAVKDYESFVVQRQEIRSVVFDERGLYLPDQHVTFWNQVAAGEVEGVLK